MSEEIIFRPLHTKELSLKKANRITIALLMREMRVIKEVRKEKARKDVRNTLTFLISCIREVK